MKIAITTYCTKGYTYAHKRQIQSIVDNIRYSSGNEYIFIMVGDKSKEVSESFSDMSSELKECNVKCRLFQIDADCNQNKQHNEKSNIVIARLQEKAWNEAKKFKVDGIWSLESDIIPEPNALQCLIDATSFDKGFYDVAMSAYANTAILGGYGTPSSNINPCIFEDERELSDEIKEEKAEIDKYFSNLKLGDRPSEEINIRVEKLRRDIESSPAKHKGNVFALNGERWRPRGWFDMAYPAIGIGAMLPTDWVGLGSTFITRKALEIANFNSYDGKGTQDLWLCWKVWHPSGVKMSVVPHSRCSHIKYKVESVNGVETKKLVSYYVYHDIENFGHIRTREIDFFN